MRAEQVPEVTTSLNPDDVFVLETPNKVYVWHGQTSSQVEKDEAVLFLQRTLGEDKQTVVIAQGSEPDDFFSYLNGDASQVSATEAWRERVTKRIATEARLFDADLFGDNTVNFEEIVDIKQSELHSDDAYVLDSGDELYIWIGKDTTDHVKKSGYKIAEAYLRRGHHTGSAVAVVVKQGLEPELFKSVFEDWDPQMWMKKQIQDDEDIRTNEILA